MCDIKILQLHNLRKLTNKSKIPLLAKLKKKIKEFERRECLESSQQLKRRANVLRTKKL